MSSNESVLHGKKPKSAAVRKSEEVLNNKKSPQQALDDAAKEITTKIQDYNRTVK